jgi:FMN phosphatase YigB (HAD superfamily)
MEFDDVAGAQAIGMRGVLTHQYRTEEPDGEIRPDATIERIAELPALLSGW